MGNAIGKEKNEDTVDGGQLVPHGIYKGPQDWDYRAVRKLIIERKLSPFYKGLSDYDDNWDEVTLTTHNLPKIGETKKSSSFSNDSNASANRDSRRNNASTTSLGPSKGKDPIPVKSLEAQLYRGAVECPICFLYYPRNINHSRCCDQPICTECFVQIKRPENGNLGANNSPAVCPFCVETNFGVCYKPPSFSAGINASDSATTSSSNQNTNSLLASSSSLNPQDGMPRRKSMSHKNPEVVTSDAIRPDLVMRASIPPRQPNARRSSGSTPNNPRRLAGRPGGTGAVVGTPTSPPRRNNGSSGTTEYGYLAAMRSMGTDLEELMVMEAIRLSILEQEERERRESARDENVDNSPNEAFSAEETATRSARASLEQGPNNDSEALVTIISMPGQNDMDEDNYENSSTSRENDNSQTIISRPQTASVEDGIIISTSVASSSSGSQASSPSSLNNSTHDPLSTSSRSVGTYQNIGNIRSSMAASSSASNVNDVLPPPFDDHTNDAPPPIEQDDNEVQPSARASVNIKIAPFIILPGNTIVTEAVVMRNERDDDSRDPTGSWEPA